MDPFQHPSRGPHAFRVVPMTHLTRSAETDWGVASREESRTTPQTVATDPLYRGSTVLSRREGLLSSEADGGSVENVRKWQQFGLRVATAAAPLASSLAPPPLPRQQQLAQANQHPLSSSWRTPSVQLPPCSRHAGEEKEEAQLVNRVVTDIRETHTSDRRLDLRGALERDSVTDNTLPLRRSRVGTVPGANAHSAEGRRTHAKELAVVEIVDDDDSRTPPQGAQGKASTAHTLRAPPDRSPSSPTPAAPVPSSELSRAPAADTKEAASADAARRLQLTLAQLSEKVQHSTEEQRCGPPKRNGGGGEPDWASKRWKGRAGKNGKSKATEARRGSDNAADESSNLAALDGESAKRTAGTTKGSSTRKRGRASNDPTVRAPEKKGGGRKRTVRNDDDGASDGNFNVPRTLFSLSATSGRADVARSMAGLSGVPSAAATVSVPFFYLQASTEDLFDDIRRMLNDPDRIQAPPLFVGISTLANDGGGTVSGVECRTNFTYHSTASKTVKGRASSCFSSIDPMYSNQHVELVVARWKDAVYALPAQTLGFPFLCRVLTELPGVELITFNAQATLIALLAHCKGTLWSHCISDVRVMAWMAQLHAGGASAHPSRTGVAGAFDGAGDAADMNVLYDYEQLLLRVSSGKPPPSVMLERTSEAESYSAISPAHTTGGFTTALSNTEAAAPPLTPAQRLLAQQVYYLAIVYRSLYGLLGSKGLLQAFLRQEKRIALLLSTMRYNGFGVALSEVHRYQRACEAEMARQRAIASTLVPEMGDDFNIQSHDQCRKALYEVLQLGKYLTAKMTGSGEATAGSGLTITKGGRLSTAEETLRSLAPHHEFPACLLKYRKASKLMQTYVEGMMSYAIVRAQKTSTAAVSASVEAASRAGSPLHSPLNENSSSSSVPQLLGETFDVGDAGNPFVDRQLCTGVEATGHGSRSAKPTTSPTNVSAPLTADEEASVTAVGDLTLPGCGYATIHPNFLQEGTDTGRLSCVEPNLQNLPRNGGTSVPAAASSTTTAADGEESEEDLLGFRRCFVAPAGSVLLSVDYQQIELRVLAHLCGDKSLVDALTKSADIHRAIAEVVFKKKPVSADERTLAKRVVFGMLYGAGPKTLAAHMGVNVERALHITSLLTNAFPGIETYHRRVIEESRANGFVRTISGRLRYLPDIQSTVMSRRSYAERQAFNSVVQGSAADVMKMAMLAVAKDVLQCYGQADVRLLSQIHDEMVFAVRKELLPTLVPIISSAMSHAMHLLVPLSVTVKFGHSLGDLQEWSVEHDLGLGVDG